MFSKLGKLDAYDLFKGLIVAAGTAMLTGISTVINNGRIPNTEDLKVIGIATLAAVVTYLLKNLFTNSGGLLAGPENKAADNG